MGDRFTMRGRDKTKAGSPRTDRELRNGRGPANGRSEYSEYGVSSGFGRGRSARERRGSSIALFAFLFVSFALLVFSRLELGLVQELRWRLTAVAAPVLSVTSAGVVQLRRVARMSASTFDAMLEVERLREENQRLRSWEWRARALERKVGLLSALTRAGEDTGLEFVTARVLADGRGPFNRSVLLDTGSARGVKTGFAAVNGDGVIGHIVDTGETASRVLLLSDVSSRVPVLIGPAGARAILSGDQTAHPVLAHMASDATIQNGDEVYTSGHEGMLPRGLKIGVIKLINGEAPRVQLSAHLDQLDYVSVLFFERPSLQTAQQREPEQKGAADRDPARRTVLNRSAQTAR